MALTKFFRIAIEGETVDGRKITADTINQMAEDYDPDTYTAVINCEHLRGYSPTPPFNSYGHVAELRAQDDEIKLGKKTVTRRALYARFDVNEQAKAANKAGQKLFSSMEVHPKLPETGRAYMLGCAITDSPASLATQVLKFSRDDNKKDMLVTLSEDFELEFEDEAATSEVSGAFAAMKKFFENFNATPKPEPKPVVDPVPPASAGESTPPELAAFAKQMAEGMDKLATAFTTATASMDDRLTKMATDFATLKGEVEKAKPSSYRARPNGTGGGDRQRAAY